MSRIRRRGRSTRHGKGTAEATTVSRGVNGATALGGRGPRVWLSILLLALLLLSTALAFHWFGLERGSLEASVQTSPPPVASYVGAADCARCHRAVYERWQDSHHAQAMRQPNARHVLGDFNNVEFTQHGHRTSFFQRDKQFMVRTEGPDGRPADFPVKFTFGWQPLQQYLLQLPGGRLQAFPIAWDSRARADGGQRWLDLYADEQIGVRDPLHWTGPYLNWNFMCADCHSTNVRHNYDAKADHFDTQWSEINVACEACHGPGSAHVGWAEKRDRFWNRWRHEDETRGLTVRLASTSRPERRAALRSQSAVSFAEGAELKACAVCHARRTALTNEFLPSEGFDQHFLAALMSDDLYHVDGQIKDEVYEYNSFRQSKMFARGVTCSDCHDPHSLQLRSDGKVGVCLQCHDGARYDAAPHHHHPTGSGRVPGCVDCHMPQHTYMAVDPRRDHSFRVPRPDLTVRYGVPNACEQCHREKSANWAAEQTRNWLGRDPKGLQQFADAIHAVRTMAIGAEDLLRAALRDTSTPPIAKGSLLADAGPVLHAIADELPRSLDAPFVAERVGALHAIESLPVAQRWAAAEHLLDDPERAVRIEAARILADAALSADQRRRLAKPLRELREAGMVYASRPQWRVMAATVDAKLGEPEKAIDHLEAALRIQPSFSPAYANLADLYRSLGQEDRVRAVLERGLTHLPNEGALHYALGLYLVRSGRTADGIAEMKRAVELSPDDALFAYGYAVGLYSATNKKRAFDYLQRRLTQRPNERSTLYLLAQTAIQENHLAVLKRYRPALDQLATADPQARQLVEALRHLERSEGRAHRRQ